jgi:hypothetical protein
MGPQMTLSILCTHRGHPVDSAVQVKWRIVARPLFVDATAVIIKTAAESTPEKRDGRHFEDAILHVREEVSYYLKRQ